MSKNRIDAEDLLLLLSESTGPQTRVRDGGLLYAAAERPEAVILGTRFYIPISWRAAALLHSIIRWKPLDLSNAGLGWRAVAALIGIHGRRLVMPARDRMSMTDDINAGRLDDVEETASRLDPFLQTR